MAQGTDVIIGHAKGTTWNTAVTVNVANAGLLLTQWPIGNGLGDLLYDDSLSGSGFRSNAIRGLTKLTGDAPGNLRYTGLEHAVAMSMGIAGVPTTADTTARIHTFQLATNLDGLFDTVAVFKGTGLAVWEYPSLKYGGFSLNLTADGLATITFPVVASSCKPVSGQVNTTLAAVTYRSKVLNVFGTHIKWRANAASGGALSDADKFYPNSMTFTYRRAIDSSFVFDGSGVMPEPYYTAAPEVTLQLEFPVYGTGTLQTNNTFMTNAFSEIPMKMDITMTSPVLAGAATSFHSILIEAPNVVIGNVNMPVNGPGVIPQSVQMAMIEAAVAPTGMVGLTKCFRWVQTSKMATDALLAA
jgi:hypothetical protein